MKIGDADLENIEAWAVFLGVSMFFVVAPGFEWVLKNVFFSFFIA